METESNGESPDFPEHSESPPQAAFPEGKPKQRPLGPPPANVVDLLLRRPDALLSAGERDGMTATMLRLGFLALAGLVAYGLVVGSFSGGVQWWAAPVKIAMGTFLCGAICFPSLYICLSLGGAQVRMPQVLVLLFGTCASTAIFLGGFAPVTWVFSTSSTLVPFVGALHLLVWTISLFASQRILRNGLATIGARNSGVMSLWAMVLFVTTLQMMTVLRPLVGTAPQLLDRERKFFLMHWGETVEAAGTQVRHREPAR
jgi:hypothetical protein